jgi:hypothetical protein
MPTLPGRESSILSVLAEHVATLANPNHNAPNSTPDGDAESLTPAFDWHALVQAARPGAETERQRAQAARFARVRQEAEHWADALGVSREHLEESSFYAVACTAPECPHEQAIALALGVYWIYLLDDFLDRRDFAALGAAGEGHASALDGELDTILAPLAAYAAGRKPSPRPIEPDASEGETTLTSERVQAALGSLLGTLERAWQGAGASAGVRRRLIARALRACAVAMRREALWNAALARQPEDPRLPRFEEYLPWGAVSIGMPGVAAIAASFEAAPDGAWILAGPAIATGGSVVRLTNDLHTYFADVDECKVSAITVRLRDLGHPPTGLHPDTSPGVREAQVAVARDLARVVDRFGRAVVRLPEGPLAHCVSHAVAFALAVYGDGSQFREPAQLHALP